MSKHTPGPWSADIRDGGLFPEVKLSGCTYGIIVGAGRAIELGTGHTATQELQANARLIAAAPDLLAACEAARDAISRAQHRGPMDGLEAQALRLLAAAIAKARGTP